MVILIIFSELKFDAIVASEIIEHVDNPQLFINTNTSLLKVKGAKCFLIIEFKLLTTYFVFVTLIFTENSLNISMF